MAKVIHFPKHPYIRSTSKDNHTFSIFSDLSDLLGIDLKKVVIDQDKQESAKLEKKLQKDSLKVRSNHLNQLK